MSIDLSQQGPLHHPQGTPAAHLSTVLRGVLTHFLPTLVPDA